MLSLPAEIQGQVFSRDFGRNHPSAGALYRLEHLFVIKNGELTAFSAVSGNAGFSADHLSDHTIFYKIQKNRRKRES